MIVISKIMDLLIENDEVYIVTETINKDATTKVLLKDYVQSVYMVYYNGEYLTIKELTNKLMRLHCMSKGLLEFEV